MLFSQHLEDVKWLFLAYFATPINQYEAKLSVKMVLTENVAWLSKNSYVVLQESSAHTAFLQNCQSVCRS